MAGEGKIHQDTEHGIAASHPERELQPFLVAPTTGDDFNTFALDIDAVACVQLRDILFEFDSSFPTSNVAQMLKELPGLRDKNKNDKGQFPPMSIFGHADPAGEDAYNKQLSGRRAMAIFSVLTRDLTLWNFLFDNPFGGDDWKAKNVLASMRSALGATASQPRQDLSKAYMQLLSPTQFQKSDFLGQGKDAKGKADFQGCSEFNPLMLLSTKENQSLTKAKRNEENAGNRRVVIFLFRAGMKVNAATWPCPTALAGTAECVKRFFGPPKTGEIRRKPGPERREFAKTEDTFACRFYDRIARLSPCEKPVPLQDVNPIIILGASAPRPSSAIRDANIIGRNFVVVKKPYTKPARVPVTLQSDRSFEGTGEFTVQDSSNLRFFPDKDSLLQLRFNGVDNVFNGEQLSPPGPGVTVFAEGIKASRAVDDITLTLTISAKFATIAKVTRVQMTAVDVILDIAAPRTSPGVDPVPLPQPTTATAPPGNPTDKLFGGRFIRVQDPKKTQERAMLIVRLRPETFVTTLELIANATIVSMFNDENPGSAATALTLPLPIGSDTIPQNGRRLFVQGDTVSKALRDVQFQLGIQGVEPDCDRVAVTVTAAIDFIIDANDDHVVDENEPVATFVRMGLWDHAFSAPAAGAPAGSPSTLNNDTAELRNFVGADSRRFYLRVKDPTAHDTLQVDWRTLQQNNSNLDAPTNQKITLIETGANTGVFSSRALMVVSDRDDQQQPTHSGLPVALPGAGVRNFGQSDHRIRLARLDGFVEAQYTPTIGAPAKVKIPVFRRAPEERRKLPLQIFVLRVAPGGAGVVSTAPTSDLWNVELRQIREIYGRIGIKVETVVAPGTPPANIVTVAGDSVVLIDAPAGINPLNVSFQPLGGVNNESTLGTAFPGLANTIRLFYAGGLASGNRGEAWPDIDFAALPQNGACFLNLVAATYNAAHEIGHILINKPGAQSGAHYVAPGGAAGSRLRTDQNLMRNGTSVVEGVLESKRLWDEPDIDGVRQVTPILSSRFLHAF